ncbi:MAG: DUF6880 family protein [Janthinobacterium lividum]
MLRRPAIRRQVELDIERGEQAPDHQVVADQQDDRDEVPRRQHGAGGVEHRVGHAGALDVLERKVEAEDLRWTTFQRFLSVEHLRAHLRGLRDFDDVEAEERAIAHALAHSDQGLALMFLVAWPNLKSANQLVRDYHDEFDGREYFRLRPAAEVLAEKYPMATTLLHRALAEDVLRRASSRQYQYAARDVRACAGFAAFLPTEAGLETHDAFMARLRREHPRKTGFWSSLDPGAR